MPPFSLQVKSLPKLFFKILDTSVTLQPKYHPTNESSIKISHSTMYNLGSIIASFYRYKLHSLSLDSTIYLTKLLPNSPTFNNTTLRILTQLNNTNLDTNPHKTTHIIAYTNGYIPTQSNTDINSILLSFYKARVCFGDIVNFKRCYQACLNFFSSPVS